MFDGSSHNWYTPSVVMVCNEVVPDTKEISVVLTVTALIVYNSVIAMRAPN
jgi:hypothetical protein